MDTPERIDVRRVRDLLDHQADLLGEGLHPSPRSCLSARALYCRYYRWFMRPQLVPTHRGAPRLHLPMKTVRTLLRFRLGCHDLPIDTGRRQGIPRDESICTRCSLGMVGDEFHFLFICPLLEQIRSQFSHLFHPPVRSVTRFMWQRDGEGVARFVVNALKAYMNASGTSNSLWWVEIVDSYMVILSATMAGPGCNISFLPSLLPPFFPILDVISPPPPPEDPDHEISLESRCRDRS
eukprot:jgi/Botrbrau1/20530/Bobra.145_2s0079.1